MNETNEINNNLSNEIEKIKINNEIENNNQNQLS